MAPHCPTIQIGNRTIGKEYPTYIIAEIGINHNGDPKIAEQLIDTAADAKVDAVKFQKRHLPSLYKKEILTDTLRYEQNFQYMIPILKDVELNETDYAGLKAHAERKGLDFLCTPFDIASADFLTRLGIPAFKIASADLTNLELLAHVAETRKPMVVSTGMSYWEEIEKAVRLLKQKNAAFALLHCRSVYPVYPREVNLKMISQLCRFGCPVGYSGHDIGITIPLVASSMGASIIEKHITLDKKMRGPDHKISLLPDELKQLVRDIRVADLAMGKSKRFLLRGEILNRELFGKSLIASVDIAAGTRITRDMIRVQGPGKGLSPSKMDDLIGTTVLRELKEGEYFFEEDIQVQEQFDFRNSFRTRWGLISRFSDMKEIVSHKPKAIEFHLAEKDFHLGYTPNGHKGLSLIVHAPEYIGDHLFDLCCKNEKLRAESVALARQTVDLARTMAPHFKGVPKVILHPGAMSLNEKLERKLLSQILKSSLQEIAAADVEILLENLPPYPWYFGGQWMGNFFMNPEEIRDFCRETRLNICFDLSHAALYCNAKEKDLAAYIRTVKPFIRHIHFADAYGLDGEGVQIGEGDIDFESVMPLFEDYEGTWVPEIWRGHLQNGKGFLEALFKLKSYGL
ncbi:MAG: N-acetylneuraminate synthase [Desulfobacteraceae bacterium]|nr:MAG: N-acetylneuraminate synthase [Desulfobacteraceae bacterium]